MMQPERITARKTKGRPASSRLRVEITAEDIAEAMRRDSFHWMIVGAVKRSVPGASLVTVDLQAIRLTDQAKHLRHTYLTPRVAREALVKFDQGIAVEPFTFQLRRYSVQKTTLRQKPENVPECAGGRGAFGARALVR